MNRTLEALKDQVEAEGLREGTAAYETRLMGVKAENCARALGIESCAECSTREFCALLSELRTRIIYGEQSQ